MKRIKFKDMKVGNYCKGILKSTQKIGWNTTFFIIERIRTEKTLWGNCWVDFDDKGKFIEIIKNAMSLDMDDVIFYKLTEKEFYDKVSKYLVLAGLENES